MCMWGLIENGAYSEFWLQGEGFVKEGPNREEGLIELLRYTVSYLAS